MQSAGPAEGGKRDATHTHFPQLLHSRRRLDLDRDVHFGCLTCDAVCTRSTVNHALATSASLLVQYVSLYMLSYEWRPASMHEQFVAAYVPRVGIATVHAD